MRETSPAGSLPLRAAARLVIAEGALLAVAGLGYGLAGVVGHPRNRLAVALGAALAVLAGGLVVALGRALGRHRAWARSPVIVVQLLAVPVSAGLLQGHLYLLGIPVLAVALAVLGGLVAPSARAQLAGTATPRPTGPDAAGPGSGPAAGTRASG